MIEKLRVIIDNQIIRHFRDSRAPVPEVALGGMIGMFWALTPLIGIQMALVTGHWLIMRSFGFRFYLPIALAMVWITNPVTMPFFYYGFYIAGSYLFQVINSTFEPVSFEKFSQILNSAQTMPMLEGILEWGKFMIYELGTPMLVGGFLIGIPVSIAFYPITARVVRKHRKYLASREGITMEEWEARHLRHDEKHDIITDSNKV